MPPPPQSPTPAASPSAPSPASRRSGHHRLLHAVTSVGPTSYSMKVLSMFISDHAFTLRRTDELLQHPPSASPGRSYALLAADLFNKDGMIHICDLTKGQWVTAFQSAADTVNGFSFHPYLPFAVTSSGHKRFSLQDEFEEELNLAGDENCCSVWMYSSSSEEA